MKEVYKLMIVKRLVGGEFFVIWYLIIILKFVIWLVYLVSISIKYEKEEI